MCLNGGKLHLCDHCPQAVCHQCLPPPHDLDISTLDFVCLACHEIAFKTEPRQPYYVSCQLGRARHKSGYLRRYLRVHPWENPCKRITHIRVTQRLKNPQVQVSILDHMQPVQVTRTTRVCFSKHSHATTTRHMGSFKNEVG